MEAASFCEGLVRPCRAKDTAYSPAPFIPYTLLRRALSRTDVKGNKRGHPITSLFINSRQDNAASFFNLLLRNN